MRASWSMLLDGLDCLGSAREVAPGEIEVWLTQGRVRRRIVVLMTAAEWDEMASVMWGNADDALADVKRTVSSLGPGSDDADEFGPVRMFECRACGRVHFS